MVITLLVIGALRISAVVSRGLCKANQIVPSLVVPSWVVPSSIIASWIVPSWMKTSLPGRFFPS